MTFKKLSIEELKYELIENIIGLPFVKEKEAEQNIKNLNGIQSRMKLPKASSKEFNSVVGKKKAVPIIFEVNEKVKFDDEMKIATKDIESLIKVKNISSNTRLWNIRMELDTLKTINISEINLNEEWKQKFKIENIQKTNYLCINEKISHSDYISDPKEKSDAFLEKSNKNLLYFTIIINNPTDKTINKFLLSKILPKTTIRIQEYSSRTGSVNVTPNRLYWEIDEILPGRKHSLKFAIQVKPIKTKSGNLSVRYLIENKQLFENKLKSFTADIKGAQFLNIEEVDESPNFWDCSINLLNQSDYSVKINKCELFQIDNGEQKLIPSMLMVNQLLPFQEDTLIKTSIESTLEPKFTQKIDFTPEFEIKSIHQCDQDYQESDIEILDFSANKNFSVPKVKSYEKSSFEGILTIENLSTVPINHLLIEETIPRDFDIDLNNDIIFKSGTIQKTMSELNQSKKFTGNSSELEFLKTTVEKLKEKEIKLSNKILNLSEKISGQSSTDISQNLNSIKETKKNLLVKKKESKEEIFTITEEISTQENTLNQLKKDLKRLSENLKIKEENSELNNKFAKLESKLNEENEILTTISSTIKKRKNEFQLLNEKKQSIQNSTDKTEQKKENIIKEIKKLEKQIILNDKHKQEKEKIINKIKTEMKTLEKEISKSEKKIEASDYSENQKDKIEDVEVKISEINKNIDKLEINKKEILSNLEKMDNQIHTVEQKIEDELKKQTKISELMESREAFIEEKLTINERIDKYLVQIEKIDQIMDEYTPIESKLQLIREDFETKCLRSRKAHARTYTLSNSNGDKILILILNNLKDLISKVETGKKFSINYTIIADRPKKETTYKFPVKLRYNFDPAQSTQDFNIPDYKLPDLKIEHIRKKISLGKIVEPYIGEKTYSVTVLVRNKGTKPIKKLKILDVLPKDAKILNNSFLFGEMERKDDLKDIIWRIDEILPNREIEINYIVDMGTKMFSQSLYEVNYQEE